MKTPIDLYFAWSLPPVELEILIFVVADLKDPADSSRHRLQATHLAILYPRHNGGVGYYFVVVVEQIGRGARIGIKREVVAVFQVVADEILVAWVYDRVYYVDVDYELTLISCKSVNICPAGGVWIQTVICTCTNTKLRKFEDIWSKFPL